MKTLLRYLLVTAALATTTHALANDRGYYRGDHRHHSHHRDHRGHSNEAAYLVGGVLLGAAIAELADSPRRTTYTTSYPERYSSTRYREYPATYSSTSYYSETYYPQTYVTTTRTYREPVVYRERERVYRSEVIRDERGACYEVNYRHGRKILTKIPRHNCRHY